MTADEARRMPLDKLRALLRRTDPFGEHRPDLWQVLDLRRRGPVGYRRMVIDGVREELPKWFARQVRQATRDADTAMVSRPRQSRPRERRDSHRRASKAASSSSSDPDLDPPTVDAYPASGGWRVWCDHCLCWHLHGAGAGHRLAHCHRDGSPYDDTGYVLALVGRS